MGLLKADKSLAEMEEEIEYAKTKKELLQESVAIRQLEEKMGKGSWKLFSSDGTRKGFSLQKAWTWLKTH